MGFVWALAAVLVLGPTGVTLALQWSKIRTAEIKLRQSRVNAELEAKNEAALDNALLRGERELQLQLASTPEAMALVAAEKLEQAALKRLAAAEVDAKAKYADEVARQAAEDDKLAHRARTQALVRQADAWAEKNPPAPFQDPIENVDLAKLYKDHMSYCYRQNRHVPLFGVWLGENYRKAVKNAKSS